MDATKRQKVNRVEGQSTKKENENNVKQNKGFNFFDIYETYENGGTNKEVKVERVKRSEGVKQETPTIETGSKKNKIKEYVNDKTNKFTIDSINFDIMSSSDIEKCAEIRLENRDIYGFLGKKPQPLGVMDSRLGCHKNDMTCDTCGKGTADCIGHWGYIDLALPVFHIGFLKHTINILKFICKKCSCLLITEEMMMKFNDWKSRGLEDPLMKQMIFKDIMIQCRKKKKKICPRCNAPQGDIKKSVRPSQDQFLKLKHIIKHKVSGRTETIEEELNPLYVRELFRNMDPLHAKILNLTDPDKLIISNLPAPPCCIRPTVSIQGQGTTEDDLTVTLCSIVSTNNLLKNQIKNGLQANKFMGNWQFLQIYVTSYINSESPGISEMQVSKSVPKPGRGICQRLKGKEGRFRGNLSGKRVDFSARTVISPDPNVGIDEVVVPEWIARRLTFPERVTKYNIEVMKKAVLNGVSVWPGASYVNRLDGTKTALRYANPKHVADNLQIGEVVERHMWNGDLIIFNRQPSLHRLSIMCHKARVMRGSTFRFNECVCLPYNADFDGDEMNIHLPQTYEAKAEALHLMGVKNNLTTPRNGEPLIAPVQDFLCASYLLTSKDRFLKRSEFCQIVTYFTDAVTHIDIPPPAIIHPIPLWTGKQVFNVLLRPNRKCKVMVNIRVKEREYTEPNQYYKSKKIENEEDKEEVWLKTNLDMCMCPKDGFVMIYKSELVCGGLGVRSLGSSKGGLFEELMLRNSTHISSECMLRVSKLSSRWLSEFGMTIGLDDVTPGDELIVRKKQLLQEGYTKVDDAIKNFESLQPYPGCTKEETLEVQVKSILDELRNESGKICTSLLNNDNKPLIMFNSGSKGALINIAQMVACVGQQNVSGQRIQNGFVGRTLPHFPMGCKDAKSRGFVANSFFTGLEPEEFFFHTMSGREGLVDTAVKTSETGYMQRRLMKFMEDLSICYDHTVRTSDGQIVQFLYGDDGLSSALSKSIYNTLLASFEHIQRVNQINKKGIMTPGHVDPVVLKDVEKKGVKRRSKLKHADHLKEDKMETDNKKSYNNNDDNDINKGDEWILPNKNYEEFESKVEGLIDQEEFVESLPPFLKNKVKCYKSWTKGERRQKHVVKFDIDVKLGDRRKDENEDTFKKVDENIIRCVKNHLVAYYSVYVDTTFSKRSMPLLPQEINSWTDFLQPLLTEILPPTIYNHTYFSKGVGSVYEFGKVIERILKEHGSRIEEDLELGWEERFVSLKTESERVMERFNLINRVNWLSLDQIFEFIRCSWKHYQKCLCEPGEAIGALGAQSIGEPTTQMTLKTFHFAGVASMNVTLGVPRITEIINAASRIATPIIEVPLENKTDYNFALQVKSRIEKTTLGEICCNIRQIYTPQNAKLLFTLNRKLIEQLYLQVDAFKIRDIINGIRNIGKLKIQKLNLYAVGPWQLCMDLGPNLKEFFQQNALISAMLQVVISGGKEVKRAVIRKENTAEGPNYQIAVEGYGLKEVMGAEGVDSSSVKSNHVAEIAEVLGIEAARSVIISEIQKCMDAYSIDIDCRYMKLLADVMTFRGEVIGINRHGLQKMRSSTLMLASFEMTNDRLFDAAVHQRKDPIKGVSECIITGKPVSLGTGAFDIMMAQ